MSLKKDRIKFIKSIKEILTNAGATQNNSNWCYKYSLNTPYGILNISLPNKEEDHKISYHVFTEFEEPERARKKFDCGYLGKYNFFLTDKDELIYMFEYFILNVIAEDLSIKIPGFDGMTLREKFQAVQQDIENTF
jgi:hypothetical protein